MEGSRGQLKSGVLPRIERCSVVVLCACVALLIPKENKRMGCDGIIERISFTRKGY